MFASLYSGIVIHNYIFSICFMSFRVHEYMLQLKWLEALVSVTRLVTHPYFLHSYHSHVLNTHHQLFISIPIFCCINHKSWQTGKWPKFCYTTININFYLKNILNWYGNCRFLLLWRILKT